MNQPSLEAVYIFGPLTPKKNGIADYTYQLFKDRENTTYVVEGIDDKIASKNYDPKKTVITCYEFDELETKSSNKYIYQIGNNPDHTFVLPYLRRFPGIVFLHDINLYYLAEKYAELGDERLELSKKVFHEEIKSDFKRDFECKSIASHSQFKKNTIRMLNFFIPLREHVVVVHSNYAKEIIQRTLLHNNVHTLQHFALTEIKPKEKIRIKKNPIIFGSFGFYSRAKCYEEIARVFGMLHKENKNFRWIIAGIDLKSEGEILSLVERYGISSKVSILGYLETEKLNQHIESCDVIFNLRIPTSGEASGILARSMPLGTPSIVVNSGGYLELPEEVSFKIREESLELDLKIAITSCIEVENLLEKKAKACVAFSEKNLIKKVINQKIDKILGAFKVSTVSRNFNIEMIDPGLDSTIYDLFIERPTAESGYSIYISSHGIYMLSRFTRYKPIKFNESLYIQPNTEEVCIFFDPKVKEVEGVLDVLLRLEGFTGLLKIFFIGSMVFKTKLNDFMANMEWENFSDLYKKINVNSNQVSYLQYYRK